MRVRTPEGTLVDAAEVSVEGPDTKTIEFVLSDGSKLSVRVTVLALFRALAEFGEGGEPRYIPNIRVDTRIFSIPDEYFGRPSAKPKRPSRSPEVA